MIFDYLDDTSRGMSGEYGQLNVWDETLGKYVLALPLETLPSLTGDTETFDNNVTTSRTVGKIVGKKTLDNKDVTFLWHRDNVCRLEELVGRPHDFLVSYKDGTGWKFTAQITYRPDDATASDKLTGTLTFIPSQVDDVVTLNVYDQMAKTVVITNSLPFEINLSSKKMEEKFQVLLSDESGTVTVESDNTAITATYTAGDSQTSKPATISVKVASATNTSGIITITPKVTGKASWKQYILVTCEA